MPIPELYHTCRQMLRELRPEERVTRLRNFSWLLVGLYKSRSVHLSKVAENIPGSACLPSLTRRMRRLLDNRAMRVRDWYEPIAKSKYKNCSKSGIGSMFCAKRAAICCVKRVINSTSVWIVWCRKRVNLCGWKTAS